ncbi:MAG TPA: dTMP kinase [Methanothrix sp.]|nr:dTMP kinase [Methanothrix sp.]HPJ84024.1 dTMP kinase [Methanothrix sp.]HPR66707.1 dTMP kinase [Methanothrix sp.]
MMGILITFEGIDGSGKSTIAAEIARRIAEEEGPPFAGRHFLFTAEPTEGEEGRLIREKLKRATRTTGDQGQRAKEAEQLEELFLFMADHARHMAGTVIPALERGMVVISDRYSDSRVAYQGATLRGIIPRPLEWVRELHRPWSVVPERTVLFSIDPSLAVERCLSRQEGSSSERRKAPEKFEREEFLGEVARNFELMARSEPERFVVIDASRGKAEILEETLAALAKILSGTKK